MQDPVSADCQISHPVRLAGPKISPCAHLFFPPLGTKDPILIKSQPKCLPSSPSGLPYNFWHPVTGSCSCTTAFLNPKSHIRVLFTQLLVTCCLGVAPESGSVLWRSQVASAVTSGPATNVNKLVKEEPSLKLKFIKKLLSQTCAMNKTKFSVTGQWDTNICSLSSQGIEQMQKNSHKELVFAKALFVGQEVPAQHIAGTYVSISGKHCYMFSLLCSSLYLHYCQQSETRRRWASWIITWSPYSILIFCVIRLYLQALNTSRKFLDVLRKQKGRFKSISKLKAWMTELLIAHH